MGGADFQDDAVIIRGTNGKESIRVASEAFGASVLGLAAQVNITWAKPGLDRLTVNALDGDDVVAASSLSADAIHFAGDSGAGNDTFTGGAGADVLTGWPGQNQLDGRPSDNILIWVRVGRPDRPRVTVLSAVPSAGSPRIQANG